MSVTQAAMVEWDVLLDGAHHKCELPDEEPPEAGQIRMLGDVHARIDYITTGDDGTPWISGTRV